METIIVNSKDLFDKEENPTLCLSALRALGTCHLCHSYARFMKGYLNCRPVIKAEFHRDLLSLQKMETEIREKKKELTEVRIKLGITEVP